MKEKHNKMRGFTIIEMLVTIFIIGVLSVILIVNWRENEKNYLVQQVAQEIVQGIRQAQGMALSGKNYGNQTIYSYGVHFKKNTTDSYVIFGDKNNNNTYQSSASDWSEVVSINPSIEIHALDPNKDINIAFSVPDGFTIMNNNDPSITQITITIKRKNTTCPSRTCRNIIINKAGQVTIQSL